MPDNTQNAPGLQIWVTLAVTAIVLGAWIITMPTPDERQDNSIRKYISGQAKKNEKNPLILVLGSSLTACGLDDIPVLENKIAEKYGHPVRVMKIWKLNAAPEFFATLSTQLKQLHPTMIVVEGNIFLYISRKKNWWSQAPMLFKDYVDNLRKDNNYDPDFKPSLPPRTVSELEHLRTGVTAVSQLKDFAQLLGHFQKDSCKIVLFNYPLQDKLEERKWKNADTAIFYNNLRFLTGAFRFRYEDSKILLDENYFIDHGHMNAKGRRIQTDIFCNTIAYQLHLP
jgi:hypothetical protein